MRWYSVSVDGQLVEERITRLRNLVTCVAWCLRHASNLLTLQIRTGDEWSDPWGC